jgi:hypothetical protein
VRTILIALALALAGCSAFTNTKAAKPSGPSEPPGPAVASNKHPLAKYVELSGFRMSEAGPGNLKIKFSVINHSNADIGDLGFHVKLTTTAAKPEDPPVSEFDTKIAMLGPEETHDVTVMTPTKLRIYELPDWQFLRAQFEITSPAP